MAVLINREILSRVEVPGFGDYPLPDGKTFDQMQAAAKLQKIAFAIFFGIVAICSVALVQVCIPLAVLASFGFSVLMIKSIVETMGIGNRVPPMNDLFPAEKIDKLPNLGEISEIPCTGFPTKDGPDSQYWKENLIRSARHSIILSGCYCGGSVFDKTLGIIAEQMREFPAIKTFILASAIMITPENQDELDSLLAEFPDRFTCVKTPEIFPLVSPVTNAFILSSNHTKALVIDFGAYFMLGGTGIVSSFAEQVGLSEPLKFERKTDCINSLIDSFFKMRAFRDMDFVFHSELNGIGTKLHVEFMKLVEAMRYRQTSVIREPDSDWPDSLEASCDLFSNRLAKAENLKVACYASGPESEENLFLDEMIAKVNGAKKSIVIDNLYFHPPKRLFEALVKASNKGVKITILTNKNGSKSPGSHAFYSQLSAYHSKKLFEGRVKSNVELYEFQVPYTSLHKKVMIIDGEMTFVGSSNMAKKSLESLDYEVNLKIESADFATQVMHSIEEDKSVCQKVPDEEAPEISCMTHVISSAQSLLSWYL